MYVGIGICILISVIDVRNYIIPDMLLCVLALIFFIPDIIFVPKQIPLQLVQGLAIFLLFALIYRFVGGLGFGGRKDDRYPRLPIQLFIKRPYLSFCIRECPCILWHQIRHLDCPE